MCCFFDALYAVGVDKNICIRVQRSNRTVKHRRRIPVVTAKIVRSPSPRQRRERTSINKAVWFRRVSTNIPHTCFERAAILQRLPKVSTSQSDRTQRRCRRKNIRTVNPQSTTTDTRVVSRDSCEDRSSEGACTHQLLGRHACTQCHDASRSTVTLFQERRRGPVVGRSLWTRPLLCQCLSDETLKPLVPSIWCRVVSMPGEVKDPTQGVNV